MDMQRAVHFVSSAAPLGQVLIPVSQPASSQVQASNISIAVQPTATTSGHEVDPLDNDKRAIFRHPLFPLLALLFEKCEQASQTPDCPSSESFDVDIQSFVRHQEKDQQPFFSEDPDLDGLMVKAIQVLRIHLLELEKVNELCKDFCNRYISCLKGKLQSENILRLDGEDSPINTPQLVTTGAGVVLQQNVPQQPAASMATLNQGQIVSGGTLYQMVPTPQGLVAQPIQLQTPQIQTSQAVIHGSTPLSQIGVATTQSPTSSNNVPNLSSVSTLSMDDSFDSDKKGSKRGVLPKQATQIMKSWLFQHIVHPYPTEDEKRQIAQQTNLSLLQVNNWFINARRRILQPMLDASNPEQTKTKKNKSHTRPVQRFWPDSIANLQAQVATTSAGTETQTTTAVSSQPQQIIIPPGTIITTDGQLVNMSTGQPVTLSALQGPIINQPQLIEQNSKNSSDPTDLENCDSDSGD